MFCPECLATVYLIVDGKRMSEDELLHLPKAPKAIERKLTHKRWCSSQDHLMQIHSDYTKSYWSKGQ